LLPEQLSTAREPPGDGALGPAELPTGPVLTLTLDVAEHQRRPIFLGQAGNLLIQDGPDLLPGRLVDGMRAGHGRKSPFSVAPDGCLGPGPHGDPLGHRVQPGPQRPAPVEGCRFARQHDKGGLEAVLGQVQVAEDTLADAQHHRTVPLDEDGERVRVRTGGEPAEQVAVAAPIDFEGRALSAQAPQHGAESCVWHVLAPPPMVLPYGCGQMTV
jgi:hypothetical protein